MNIKDVPINTMMRESKCPNSHWISKSAVRFKNWLGQSVLVHGFSLHSDNFRASFLSHMEVLERFFAHYDFVKKDKLQWTKWPKENLSGEIPSHEVLLGPTPGYFYSKWDASGLSWHENVKKAEGHALLEILERHLLCLWWYRDMKLVKIQDTIQLTDDIFIEFVTADLPTPIPFVIAIAFHRMNHFWLCGSAVCNNILSAKEKARNEAFMLLDGILNNDQNKLNPNKETSSVLISLRTVDVSTQRQQFYQSSLCNNYFDYNSVVEMEVAEIYQRVFGRLPEIKSVVIKRSEEGSLVRILCDSALKIKNLRRLANGNRLLDPFC